MKHANTIAIEPEILVAAIADQNLWNFIEQQVQDPGIRIPALPETLVGGIDKGDATYRRNCFCNLLPLLDRRVDARWIVATGLKNNDIATITPADGVKHRPNIKFAAFDGTVIVLNDLQPGRLHDRGMVGPGRDAEQDLARTSGRRKDRGSDGQCTRATDRLDAL